MKFSILRSGSSGNCSLIEEGGCRVLIDAGMSQKRIREVLEEVGTEPSCIKAVIATHLHSDHINYSTLQICRKFQIPLWVHQKNLGALKNSYKADLVEKVTIHKFTEEPFTIGPFSVQPFVVSHDAYAVTSGLSIRLLQSDDRILTYAADLGHFPDTLIPHFQNARAIVLEANHDRELLWNNPRRPYIHKKRVAGDTGHLSNEQSAEALIKISKISSQKPQLVVLCHLSQDHNTPDLAIKSIG